MSTKPRESLGLNGMSESLGDQVVSKRGNKLKKQRVVRGLSGIFAKRKKKGWLNRETASCSELLCFSRSPSSKGHWP